MQEIKGWEKKDAGNKRIGEGRKEVLTRIDDNR